MIERENRKPVSLNSGGEVQGELVLLRHGQSLWNLENIFTGWTDVDLTEQGVEEAHRAGDLLRQAGFQFDVGFTSRLKRAIRSLWIVMEEIDQMWLPEEHCWRLNERHYGALQGLSKEQMAAKVGDETVFHWRRGYTVQPPALTFDDPHHPRFDPRYSDINPYELPSTESLHDTLNRVLPCWVEEITPHLRRGERVLVVAHHNSLRALVKYLDHIPDDEIAGLNIPTGYPLIYDLDANLKPVEKYYLGNPEDVKAAAEAVYRIPEEILQKYRSQRSKK